MEQRTLPEQPNETPREREYRKQINDLHAKLARQRENLNGQIEAMRRARMPASEALQHAEKNAADLRARIDQLHAKLSAAQETISAMEERLAAGASRREAAIHALNALLTCEDDDTLSDDAYEQRMDAVVRTARTIVSAERAVRLATTRGNS